MSRPDDWMRAFAKQAGADLEMWQKLQGDREVLQCHKLPFLQMACEKTAKAHRCGAGDDPDALRKSHVSSAKTFPKLAEHYYARAGKSLQKQRLGLSRMRALAREIELLAPSVKGGGRREDNCEYPWELSDGTLRVPAEHAFPNLSLLTAPDGRTLLKIVRAAIAARLEVGDCTG